MSEAGRKPALGLKESLILRVAKRWISGADLESALLDARLANERGMGAVINFLGEEITDPAAADMQVEEYLRLQQGMYDRNLKGFASVKLTQFGLVADEEGAVRRLNRVADNAERLGQQLWIDMENSRVEEDTVRVYLDALKRHRTLGVALQAYMRRSEADLKTLLDAGGRVRLVKGAYRESREVVYGSRKEVAENFRMLMAMLFDRGEGFAIGTHDSRLVEEARRLADSKHVDFEFEMLKGIRNELKEELVKSGYRVSEYLPYGDRWLAYSRRRMTEHPGNVWLLLRSLV
ncbi:MAG: proline dehydrogenase family protein [Thaumarchaeota archaeon]|nr:proline dehydrogenase family protein [Nitrososphaerota archaeon]